MEKCLFCDVIGHTPKYCPFIKAYLYPPATDCLQDENYLEYVKYHNLAKQLWKADQTHL